MKIIFPCDYFDLTKVDHDYEQEYQQALRRSNFEVILFDYDEFITAGTLTTYPASLTAGSCVYRGWMLKPNQYQQLYTRLENDGVILINTPQQYNHCHLFPSVYESVKTHTPLIKMFEDQEKIDWQEVKRCFPRFLIKDYVKSVKGTAFPPFFDGSYSDQQLDEYVDQFIALRGSLFTGGIVIKEYVDLVRRDGQTNEFRAFILNGEVLTVTRNAEQSEQSKFVPMDLVKAVSNLPSNFYTADFAELVNGTFILIETGDGQVSGLSPNQDVDMFYREIKKVLAG